MLMFEAAPLVPQLMDEPITPDLIQDLEVHLNTNVVANQLEKMYNSTATAATATVANDGTFCDSMPQVQVSAGGDSRIADVNLGIMQRFTDATNIPAYLYQTGSRIGMQLDSSNNMIAQVGTGAQMSSWSGSSGGLPLPPGLHFNACSRQGSDQFQILVPGSPSAEGEEATYGRNRGKTNKARQATAKSSVNTKSSSHTPSISKGEKQRVRKVIASAPVRTPGSNAGKEPKPVRLTIEQIERAGILPRDHKPARGRGRQIQLKQMTTDQIKAEALARLAKNRDAARGSRQKRKEQIVELEAQVSQLQLQLESEAAASRLKISLLEATIKRMSKMHGPQT